MKQKTRLSGGFFEIREKMEETRRGKAEGHNWWCVLYPQLSKGAATVDDALIKTGFSSEQIELLTGNDRIKYKLRFKILEIFG